MTKKSVAAIRGIGSTIAEVCAIAEKIATAVDEQGGVTHQITDEINQTVQHMRDVGHSIGNAGSAADTAAEAAGNMLSATASLTRETTGLCADVEAFASQVRAA